MNHATNPLTQQLLHGPLFRTMGWLALPNLADAAARVAFLGLELALVAPLGFDAMAGLGLVLPLYLLMMTVSNAGLGIGVAAAVARALGAGRPDRADAIAWHALVLALLLGALFSLCLLWGAEPLQRAMGAGDAAIGAARTYGHVLYWGAPLICLSGMLMNVCRGAGQTGTAAAAMVLGELAHLALGWVLTPALGLTGAALSGVVAFAVSSALMLAFLHSRRSLVRLRAGRLSREALVEILPTGLLASINAALLQAVNLALTATAAGFGAATLAGVGLALRFEMLLLPIVFSIGSALVVMVGANVGAGQERRAKHTAWCGALLAFGIGCIFAALAGPGAGLWLPALAQNPEAAQAARAYLAWLAPSYPLYAAGIALFLAAQGAGLAGAIFISSVLRSALVLAACWWIAGQPGAGVAPLGAWVSASVVLFTAMALASVWRARWGGATSPQSSERKAASDSWSAGKKHSTLTS